MRTEESNMPKYSEEELLDYLRDYWEEEGERPTTSEFAEDDSKPAPQTYSQRFGSWSEALQRLGFDVPTAPKPDSELIQSLQSVSEELGHPPSMYEIADHDGSPHPDTYQSHFGSWANAVEAAGLNPGETGPVEGASKGGLTRDHLDHIQNDSDDAGVQVAEGATVEATFPGSPGTVRAIQTSEGWGVVATDIDPADAVEIEHMAPADGSAWTVLRSLLLDLADADCQPSQMLDYLAIDKCGIEPTEWAQRRGTMTQTVEKSARKARERMETEE